MRSNKGTSLYGNGVDGKCSAAVLTRFRPLSRVAGRNGAAPEDEEDGAGEQSNRVRTQDKEEGYIEEGISLPLLAAAGRGRGQARRTVQLTCLAQPGPKPVLEEQLRKDVHTHCGPKAA